MQYFTFRIAASCVAAVGLATALVATNPALSVAAEPPAELVAAAKAEGTVVFYSANTVAGVEHLARAFEEKYGITVETLSLPAGTLLQRFASEAEAGSFNADVLVGANFDSVAKDDWIRKGWMIPIKDAGIPALQDGSFRAEFLNESTATVFYNPWILAYNTNLVKDNPPTSFKDLADPKYKNLVCIPDPEVALAYIEIWDLIRVEFGDEVLTGVASNQPKIYAGAGATTAALAAGECAVAAPTATVAVAALPPSAPVKSLTPAVTAGFQAELAFINPAKVAHPNAAKLLANYLLTPEGNEQQAKVGDNVWVLDPSKSAAEIAKLRPPADAANRKDQILKLLGRK
jgi:iron(III) transport system substrate-binding protein